MEPPAGNPAPDAPPPPRPIALCAWAFALLALACVLAAVRITGATGRELVLQSRELLESDLARSWVNPAQAARQTVPQVQDALSGPARPLAWRPLALWLIGVQVRFFGTDAAAYRLVSRAVHTASCCLLFGLLLLWGAGPIAAFLAGALFAIHPLQTEATIWTLNQPNVWALFFCLLAAVAAELGESRPGRKGFVPYVTSLSAAGAAFLCHELALALPFVLALWRGAPAGRRPADRRGAAAPTAPLSPFFVLIFAYIAVRGGLGFQFPLAGIGPAGLAAQLTAWLGGIAHAVVALGAVWQVRFYVPSVTEPSMVHAGLTWTLGIAALLTCAAGAALPRLPRALRRAAMWLLLFALASLLVVRVSELGSEGIAYFALPALCAASSVILTRLAGVYGGVGRRRVAAGLFSGTCVIVLLASLLGGTALRASLWLDQYTLLGSDAEMHPAHAGYRLRLAELARAEGDLNAARSHYAHASTILDAVPAPASSSARRRLAQEEWQASFRLAQLELEQAQDPRAALQALRQALALEPNDYQTRLLAGILIVQAGNTAEGIEHLRAAVQLRSDSAEAHYNLANALAIAGETEQARTHLQTAARLAPDDATIRAALATLEGS